VSISAPSGHYPSCPQGKDVLQSLLRPDGPDRTLTALASCVRNVFEWAVQPLMEIQPIPNLNDLPKTSGLYVLYDSAGNILYIGKATNFRAEVRQTLGRRLPETLRFGPKLSKRKPYLRDVAFRLSLYEILSARLRHNIEAMFLRAVANQTHNTNIGKVK
jgi:hypothetical protein